MSIYENAVEISGVSKRYKTFALDDISFTAEPGKVTAIIGSTGRKNKSCCRDRRFVSVIREFAAAFTRCISARVSSVWTKDFSN